MAREAVKVHYLDASALVKLVADDQDDEPGRDALREYYRNNTNFMTTSHCLSEAFSIFKVKYLYRKKINQEEYIRYTKAFISKIVGGKLEIDEMPILSPKLLSEAENIIKKYNLDFIDSAQIVTILHGKYSILCGDSKSILITADSDLAKASRAEGARVWNCKSEPSP
jgi:predicted nucleic acid-binding protein